MAKIYNIKKHYNSDIQIYAMKSQYPQFKSIKRSESDIEFIGELTVKPEFPTYTVSIKYRGSKSPIIKILKPELVDEPPHFYQLNKALCLYHPDNYNWTKEKLIAKDIIPWTAAWLYFYEVWLETGSWIGPEVSHNTIKEQAND